jgi:hypothetical protein
VTVKGHSFLGISATVLWIAIAIPSFALAQYYRPDSLKLSEALHQRTLPNSTIQSSIQINVNGEAPCSGTLINDHGDLLTALHCVLDCLEESGVATRSNFNRAGVSDDWALRDIPTKAFPIQCRGQFRQRGGLLYTDTDQVQFEILAAGPGYEPMDENGDRDSEEMVTLAAIDSNKFLKAADLGYLGPSSRLDYALIHVAALEGASAVTKTACTPVAIEDPCPNSMAVVMAWPKPTLQQESENQPNADGYHQVVTVGSFIPLQSSKSRLVQAALKGPEALQPFAALQNVNSDGYKAFVNHVFLDPHVLVLTANANWGSSGGSVLDDDLQLTGIIHGPNDYGNPTNKHLDFMATAVSEVRKDLAFRMHWSEDSIRGEFSCRQDDVTAPLTKGRKCR